MFGLLVLLIIAAVVALPWWYKWCDMKVELERLRIEHEAWKYEIGCCYDSEQSFLDLEDDEEHLESISPEPVTVPLQRADTIFDLNKPRLPSVTEEERAEAERELAEDDA